MASNEGNRAKRRAAEARAEAEAAEKRRQRVINVSIGAVLILVVVGIVGGAWWSGRSDQNGGSPTDGALPQGVFAADSPYAFGVVEANGAEGKPVVEIWEDFQCPACEVFEGAFGETVRKMATSGQAEVIWRISTFLDSNFPGENSKRATSAWGCAIDAGVKDAYHEIIFANQPPPEQEGKGWTNEELIAFGSAAGIKGDKFSVFEKCVTSGTYFGWAVKSTDQMRIEGVSGTPTVIVNGQELTRDDMGTLEAFKKAILGAGAPQK